jgi:RecA/RadA recombinase
MAPSNKNKKFMEKLLKLEGAVTESRNPHLNVIDSPSPSLNFTFGNGQGLPRGYSMLLYGPPRGGKSIICNAMAGRLHTINPEAWVVKFNTEFREGGQSDDSQKRIYGVDPDRYIGYEVNQPDHIFDRIEKDLAAMVQDGMDLGLVIIDSLNGVQGRRGMNADSIMTQQIGDNALTIQEGLKRILPVQRKCNFALIVTSHIRAQMDTKTGGSSIVHTSHTTAIRPAVSYGTQHHCEYYMYVAPATGEGSKADLSGKSFEDDSVEDLKGNAEKTGHKIRVKVTDNSIGPKGRVGEFTLDYHRGIINTHEEVFFLGVARGIIEKPNNVMYAFNGVEWKGKEAMANAIRDDRALYDAILQELKRRDMAGFYKEETSPA